MNPHITIFWPEQTPELPNLLRLWLIKIKKTLCRHLIHIHRIFYFPILAYSSLHPINHIIFIHNFPQKSSWNLKVFGFIYNISVSVPRRFSFSFLSRFYLVCQRYQKTATTIPVTVSPTAAAMGAMGSWDRPLRPHFGDMASRIVGRIRFDASL